MNKDGAAPNAAPADWMTQTHGFNWLRKQAADHDHLDSAMAFLKAVGVVPKGVDFKGQNWLPNLNLNPNAIRARYLAEVANDWDAMGPSTPTQFVGMLEFEVSGSTKRDIVAETLAALGAAIQAENALVTAA